jgi:hypothetical protein
MVQQIAAENEQLKAAVMQMQQALQDKDADRQLKLITQQEAEKGQDRRKAAELEVRLAEKKADLANPVSGEKNSKMREAAAA